MVLLVLYLYVFGRYWEESLRNKGEGRYICIDKEISRVGEIVGK